MTRRHVHSWERARFESSGDVNPMEQFGSLIDVFLVFVCGLIVAIISAAPEVRLWDRTTPEPQVLQTVERGRELPQLPESLSGAGDGMRPMGRVFEDPETGKIFLIRSESSTAEERSDEQ